MGRSRLEGRGRAFSVGRGMRIVVEVVEDRRCLRSEVLR
jgi:hypothetical protein